MIKILCLFISHLKSISLVVCLVTIATFPAMAEIRGSKHDFTSKGWSGGELCAVCHIPHAQNSSAQTVPLWNHELSSASYILYGSTNTIQVAEQLDAMSVSRLCLSCHDGTIAIDSFGGKQGGTYIPEYLSLGTDLSDDHPISVMLTRNSNSENYAPEVGVKVFNGKVECPSCHDVHNNQVADKKLLRVSRMRSELCYQCHDK